VALWLADARCTAAVVLAHDPTGATAASLLLKHLDAAAVLTAYEQRNTAACARALGLSTHLPAATRAQLVAGAAACETAGEDDAGSHGSA
jgi:hypothetical protein